MGVRGVVAGVIVGVVVAAGAVVAVSAGVLTGSSSLSGISSVVGYRPVPHCVVVDTRAAGPGPFVGPAARAYSVTPENGDLSSQGGSASGCGVPEGADAVFFNLKTQQVAGTGRVEVYAVGEFQNGAPVVNFDPSSFKDNAGSTTRLCQGAGCGGNDFVVNVPGQAGASTHVIVTVVGYFDEISDRTVVVGGGGSHAANGAALVDAVAAVTAMGPTAADPWLIELEPGTYDIGTSDLDLPGYINLEGSGSDATTILCTCNSRVLDVLAGGPTAIADLRVRNDSSSSAAHSIISFGDLTIRNSHVETASPGSSANGILNGTASLAIDASTISSSGDDGVENFGDLSIRDSHISTTGTGEFASGISNSASTSRLELVGSTVVSAGDDAIFNVGSASITQSDLLATNTSLSFRSEGIDNTGDLEVFGSTVRSDDDPGIRNAGTAMIRDSHVESASSQNTFWGIVNLSGGDLEVAGSTVISATSHGIFNLGTAKIRDSRVTSNATSALADGMLNQSSMTVTNSLVTSTGDAGIEAVAATTVVTNTTIDAPDHVKGTGFTCGSVVYLNPLSFNASACP